MKQSPPSNPADGSDFSREDISKLAKGSGTSLIGDSFGKGMFFVTQLLLAWYLGVEKFGLYNLGVALARIADIFARLGLSTGGMMFVSTYKDDSPGHVKGVILVSVGLSLLNGLLFAAGIYAGAPLLALHLFHQPDFSGVLQLFSFSIPAVAAMTTFSNLLQGFHTTKYTVYIRDVVQPASNLVLVLLFAGLESGLQGAVFAFTISHILGLAAGMYYLKDIFPGLLSRSIVAIYPFRALLSYSIPLLFVGVLNYFLVWTDILLLGMLASATAVGVYRAASQVPFVMTIFLRATNSIYAPVAADLFQKQELGRLGNMLKTSTRWVTYVTVPLFLFLVFSAEEIMTFFGKDYVAVGSTVLIILSFGQLVNCLTGGVGYTLTMTGKQNVELGNSLILVVASVILNLALIPKYGALGTAVASSFSALAMNALRVMEIQLFYKVNPFSKNMVPILIPVCFSAAVMPFFNFEINHIVALMINMTFLIIVFGGAIAVMRMADEDKFIIDSLRDKFLSKATRRCG